MATSKGESYDRSPSIEKLYQRRSGATSKRERVPGRDQPGHGRSAGPGAALPAGRGGPGGPGRRRLPSRTGGASLPQPASSTCSSSRTCWKSISRTWRAPSPSKTARSWTKRGARCAGRLKTWKWPAASRLMMLGDFSEDMARGVDEYMIRQPVGVAAIICPFNFPGHDPLLVPALRPGLRQHR